MLDISSVLNSVLAGAILLAAGALVRWLRRVNNEQKAAIRKWGEVLREGVRTAAAGGVLDEALHYLESENERLTNLMARMGLRLTWLIVMLAAAIVVSLLQPSWLGVALVIGAFAAACFGAYIFSEMENRLDHFQGVIAETLQHELQKRFRTEAHNPPNGDAADARAKPDA
jgi:hypothetical protein